MSTSPTKNTPSAFEVEAVSRQFMIQGDFIKATPYGSGHINDTFAAVYNQAGTQVRYIHQRINHHIFKNPVKLMENIGRVTAFQHEALMQQNASSTSRRALTLVPDRQGRNAYVDSDGYYWRTYLFIENAKTYDIVETVEQAKQGAFAFGRFLVDVAEISGPRLFETIPDFHHTPKRIATLDLAIEQDPCNRAAEARQEIDFVMKLREYAGTLIRAYEGGDIPERITHNDTKFNNVMIDDDSGEGICVIDLDTVMPGLSLSDFGDMVRTTTNSAAEDEQDLSKINMRIPMFQALAEGYLEAAGDVLTREEKTLLGDAGAIITLETGVRFLTDYLAGDVYFKIHRKGHNLDRCRAQFALVQNVLDQMDQIGTILDQYC